MVMKQLLTLFLLACLMPLRFVNGSETSKSEPVRVLIGSPICKSVSILREFFGSLNSLDKDGLQVDYLFVDDNTDEQSSGTVRAFADQNKSCLVLKSQDTGKTYICNEETHYWTHDLIRKVTAFKNYMIEYAAHNNYDYLFLLDADLVLQPQTLKHLIQSNKDIISEVFWTRWNPADPEMPQVWLFDEYTIPDAFIKQLRKPGLYEVGGLGACTLLSKKALMAGNNFNKIKNLTFWGEDRHFCVRAQVLGFLLWVDTYFPAFHLYRESDVERVATFKKEHGIRSKPKVTLSLCVHNEANNYLREMLSEVRHYIDEAVIIDDACTDDSIALCKEILCGIPVHIIRNEQSAFCNEVDLRKQQWKEVIKTNPEWILGLDADQIFEKRLRSEIPKLINQDDIDVFYFRLYDFWDNEHYREDQYWCAHRYYKPFLLRYKKEFSYSWKEQPQHCGHFPENIAQLTGQLSDIRLKHFGWANPTLRLSKYHRYKKLDPEGRWGIPEQYDSILDPHPYLKEWREECVL